MKFLIPIILTLALTPIYSFAEYPNAKDEYINDFAQIIDDSSEIIIRKKLYDAEYYSGVEISIATIESYSKYNTPSSSWEQFATGLFNYWGVGNLPKNNGVLLLISKNDRKIRIELGAGYPSHYDAIMKSVIENDIAPRLKSGDFTTGVILGVDEIIKATTRQITFLEWYKTYVLGGFGAFISLLIALFIDKKENPSLFWLFLGLAGILMLATLRGLKSGNRSEGFGGGSSNGGGASGNF
ncbi:TPM domain-containing protein [Pseudomonas leptonychotis]|uniref:TPM domain-containing protein n=1 Tax=Pseudomonas leptonychotis TaxID=2448482 RepID=UPI0039EE0BB1